MKNIIKIDDEYTIEATPNQCTLHYESAPFKKATKSGDKMVTTKDKWYYSNLKQALVKYVSIRGSEAENLLGVLKRLDELEKLVLNLSI